MMYEHAESHRMHIVYLYVVDALSWRIANRCTSGHSGIHTSHLDALAPPNDDDDVDDDVAASDVARAAASLLQCFP